MKLKSKILFFCGVLSLLVIAFLFGKCSTKGERQQGVDNLKAARDSIIIYQIVIGEIEKTVSEKDAIILNQRDAIEAGIIEREYLRKLHLKEIVTNAELTGTIKILRDSLKLVPGTIIITVKDTVGLMHDYVQIPFALIDLKEKYVTLSAGMKSTKTPWFDLKVPLSGTMTIGYKKDGFLKTKPVGLFVSENPYLKVNNMDILIVKEKEKWYDRWYVHAIFGAAILETGHQIFKK